MLANELIDRLERLGLLDQEIIEALREQLEQGGTRVTPEAVAKLLVDNGQLTHFQATKLIGELRSGQYEEEAATGVEEADLTAGLDDLEIVPDDAEVVEAVVDAPVEVVEAVPVEAVPVEAVPVEAVAVEAMPVEAVPVSASSVMSGEGDSASARPRPQSSRKKPDPEKSTWDSFKIYGYLGIIALLILMGSGIAWVLLREDADTFIARGNEFYENANYTGAQETYIAFLDTYGQDHEYSSLARTRVAMTNLYRASEFRNDPGRAIEIELEQLPIIEKENEGGLNLERANLAQLLVDVAKNIAESAVDEPETEKKRDLLSKLDQQIEFTDNPVYVTSSNRVTLSGQFEAVMEARKRIQRDINRNVSLDESVKSMGAALDGKDTKQAYDIRAKLLRDYPELFDNPRLVDLIKRASDIQHTLVEPAVDLPKVITDPPEDDLSKSIVLTTLTGGTAPDLRGETLFLRAGGSVLAFDGENGKLKWRKFVGYAKDLPPVRIDDGLGVILSESATLEVLRCDADSGAVRWRSKIEQRFSEPIAVKDDLYVAGEDGQLIKLDAESGKPDWGAQIPQPVEVGPGVAEKLDRVYLVGNHSNLYVLNARDGKCIESFYVGHAEGTVAVPPIPLLGHLFVVENAGTDFTKVHVLQMDERGENVEAAQMFRLDGNVTVSPVIEGRRLVVLTDRGEVAVYDIEPSADNDKVSIAATGPPFLDEPTPTQMAVEGSQMWISGASLGRYELQINVGRVVGDWDIYALDSFISKPVAIGDVLIHSRVLRDTKTIRVTACDPKTGEDIWRTDVGVPVAMIKPAPGKGVHVVTSQAALFQLGKEALGSGSTQGPIENPGDTSITIRFANPIAVNENSNLLLNQVASDVILVYEPNRPRELLREINLNLGDGEIAGGAIVAGGGLMLPLSTGRIVLVDWRTGSMIATPFQPASDPAARVSWSMPVALPDDADQIVIADSRKKIYRLRIAEQIRELSSKDLENELLGPTARVGQTMIGSFSRPEGDSIVGYGLANLEEAFRVTLNGRIIWGPVSAGEFSLLQTDDYVLRAFSEDGSQKFEVQLPESKPVGSPVVVGQSIVIAGASGWLISLDRESGELTGKSDLGQPLSATPYVSGKTLLVPGAEGVVFITEVPSTP